jgi:hypothetical protein
MKIQIGQRIRTRMESGIVYKIEGEQTPDNIRGLCGGVIVTGGTATIHIVFADRFSIMPEDVLQAVSWEILEEIASPGEIITALATAHEAIAAAKRTADERLRAREARRDHLLGEFSGWLEPLAGSKKSSHALAGANIRKELTRAFPGIRFSVTSKSYTGGDSVSIGWELGPTTKEVDALTDKYQEGSFNGMEDIYETDRENVWPDIFGGAKYVQTSRHDGDGNKVIACRLPSLVKRDSEWEYQNLAYRIIASHSYPPGATITGVEQIRNAGGLREEDYYRPLFRTPTK